MEQNHQTDKKLDRQSRGIVSAKKMAEVMARRKALYLHEEVLKQIQKVHEHGRRGKYKKKNRRTANSPPPCHSPVPFPSLDFPTTTSVTPMQGDTAVNVDRGVRRIRQLENFKRGATDGQGTYVSVPIAKMDEEGEGAL